MHYVADVHQPLHVGCSYLDESGPKPKMVFDPTIAEAQALDSDHGGNLVLLPLGAQGTPMHGYWDAQLGGKVKLDELVSENEIEDAVAAARAAEDAMADAPVASPASLSSTECVEQIERLVSMVKSDLASEANVEADGATSGTPESWPVAWATASLAAARSAYQGLTVDRVVGGKSKKFFVKWQSKAAYDESNAPILIERMKTAVANLALLLDTLFA